MTTCTIFNIFLPKYNNCFSHHENRKTIGLVLHIECPEWSVIIDVKDSVSKKLYLHHLPAMSYIVIVQALNMYSAAEDFWLLSMA